VFAVRFCTKSVD